nr:MAG TPA: hypothetical protein [Caudoviricetes sp.]
MIKESYDSYILFKQNKNTFREYINVDIFY